MTDKTIDADQVKDVVRRHWAARAADFDAGPTHGGLLNDAQREAWHMRLQAWSGEQPLDYVSPGTGFSGRSSSGLGHAGGLFGDPFAMLGAGMEVGM